MIDLTPDRAATLKAIYTRIASAISRGAWLGTRIDPTVLDGMAMTLLIIEHELGGYEPADEKIQLPAVLGTWGQPVWIVPAYLPVHCEIGE